MRDTQKEKPNAPNPVQSHGQRIIIENANEKCLKMFGSTDTSAWVVVRQGQDHFPRVSPFSPSDPHNGRTTDKQPAITFYSFFFVDFPDEKLCF